ncbi:MAG: ATP-dependent DNA helicase RecG [Alphaproteobacteria bacterium]|nr:ATP-dependent DNA helicase RecG [Alphaproteobacteria bacterium]
MMDIFQPFDSFIKLSDHPRKCLEKLMGSRLADVLLHAPLRFEVRRLVECFEASNHQELITIQVSVVHHLPRARPQLPYRVSVTDGKDMMELVFFQGSAPYLKKIFPPHGKVYISGQIDHQGGLYDYKMVHPDFVGSAQQAQAWIGRQPVYPLTAGLTQRFMRGFMQRALSHMPECDEWIHGQMRNHHQMPALKPALQILHEQGVSENISDHGYMKRLCFDEFLAHQLALILSSRRDGGGENADQNQLQIQDDIEADIPFSPIIQDFIKNLPFQLTQGQLDVLKTIFFDMKKSQPMVRLLQGDVGSGKTIVATLAILEQISKGGQAALLSPTGILSQQHYDTIKEFFKDHNIRIALLTGGTPPKEKRQILKDLESGAVHLVIGTHALIQDPVIFQNLTLCVIDEQHRFGVEQRIALSLKGSQVHLLSMTATPIPRTLALTCYGDMDMSLLREKPPGRIKIQTSVLPMSKYSDLVERLVPQIQNGAQCFWVCPVIEESEDSTLTAATKRFEDLQHYFGAQHVALVHGKMKPKEKDAIMLDFLEGKIKVLVATTVIEVGVNVPNATIMVIENAERFGLAQLHQLRGRVGRSHQASYCILLYGVKLSRFGMMRLNAMRQYDDGFHLAELDLTLRGAGETTGTQQSGMPRFRFANLDLYPPDQQAHLGIMMQSAHEYAWTLIRSKDNKSYLDHAKAVLLPLYQKDNASLYAQSG